MKYLKSLFLTLICLLILITCLFNDKLISYADDMVYNRNNLKEGDILVSGDYFKFDFGIDYCNVIPVHMYLEYNGFQYSSYITHRDGLLNGELEVFSNYLPLMNSEYFKQNKANEMPYVEDKTILWEVFGEGYETGYCTTDLKFIGKVYNEPKFKLFCDSEEMSADDKVACQVAIEYSDVPNKVEFELSSDKFDLTDITVFDEWKRLDDDKFIFEGNELPTNKYDDDRVTVDIIEFYITPKNQEDIDVEDAVKIDRVSWEDDFVSKDIDSNIIVPMKKKVKEDEKIEIPQTGVESYLLLGFIILIGGVILYKNIEKKGFFKRI